jgi:uncharacterized protein YjbI with pentapeptide repeats
MRRWLDACRADFGGQSMPPDDLKDAYIDFCGFIFPGEAELAGQSMHPEDLKGAYLDFSGFIFPGEAEFRGARFTSEAWFERAQFQGDARFAESKFEGNARFNHAVFSHDAWFDRVEFKGEFAYFEKAEFHGPARFRSAKFYWVAWFLLAEFWDLMWASQVNFADYASFARARFHGDAVFAAMKSERAFDLSGATFDHVPDFIEANFSEAPRLDNVILPRTGFFATLKRRKRPPGWDQEAAIERDYGYRDWLENKDISSMYRALRGLALKGHDHEREQDYFASEMRALRGTSDRLFPWPKNGARYILGILYELLSDFGRSITRPLLGWCILTSFAAVFYLAAHFAQRYPTMPPSSLAWTGAASRAFLERVLSSIAPSTKAPAALPNASCIRGTSSDPLSSAVYLAVRRGLVVGFDQSEKLPQALACLYGEDISLGKQQLIPFVPDPVLWIGFAQSMLSAVFLFFFGLALRNQFKIR